MIKLNNKNITYVALADSNNSVKGVKEIWYADSANSAKLVYRRKDALIEGEDYEKYHWLQGRNGAYIDTRYVPIPSEDSFKFKINNNGFWRNPNNNDPHVFGTYSPRIRFGTFASLENRYFFQYSNEVAGIAPNFTSPDYIQEVTLLNDGTKTKCIANGIENEYETTITEQFNDSIWLYTINNAPSKYFHGDIAYFRITDPTFTINRVNMIPCKLLKPVPKRLDANGIRRQVGECGMIDLVSGKFYGNVNSVGTFTVENYYERHKWLVGDGSAYIDTLTALSDSDTVEMKITGGTIPSASKAYKLIFGNNTNSYNYNTWVLFVGSLIAIRPTKTSSADEYRFQISTSQELTISQSTTSITVNGIEVWSGASAYTEIVDKCKLFTAGTNVTHCYDGKVAYLRIPDKLNLIPCRLLRPIPATLDGNGIARNAGECGMLDLKTMKFYGNVASGGTFTVSDN